MIKRVFICLLLSAVALIAGAQSVWTKISQDTLFVSAPFKACHASTIIETKTGRLLVACFGGSQEGKKDVGIWSGLIGKDGKVVPTEAANGIVSDTLRYPCWNPVLFKKKNGKLVLFYKVGPNPREWWGMYKLSDNNGLSWSAATRLPAGIIGPVKNKAVELANGQVLCPSSVELNNGRWQAFIERTNEQLKTWTSTPVDTGSVLDVIQPSIIFLGGKKLQILCRSKQGAVVSSWSVNNGSSWSALSKTTLLNPNSGTDAVTLRDGRHLIVYNPDVPGKDWWNGRANLNVAISNDGERWEDIMVLEHGTKQEYSYPAIIQTTDGLVHITYTYDRKNIKHVVLKEKKLL